MTNLEGEGLTLTQLAADIMAIAKWPVAHPAQNIGMASTAVHLG
jgi:hypothetical protein